jgi:hypothetical protein
VHAALSHPVEGCPIEYADRLAVLPPAQTEVVCADVSGFLADRPALASALVAGQ